MRESWDATIPLEDIAYAPFYAMLRFLYSGEAHLEPQLAIEATSHRFLLPGLKRTCETANRFEVHLLLEAALLFITNTAADRFEAP
ncbi:hypothetical protein T484DRAFT_1765988 [Baffinella frigidus]|nr:hypothetical protein T484DRAFT_1765988 [Cryptophyta sp. CCMP2293]